MCADKFVAFFVTLKLVGIIIPKFKISGFLSCLIVLKQVVLEIIRAVKLFWCLCFIVLYKYFMTDDDDDQSLLRSMWQEMKRFQY